MAKIDDFNKAKNVADRIAGQVAKCLGRDSSDNDKRTARASFCKLADAPFSPMMFMVDCSYGYYGSSSGYSATSADLGKFLAAAINNRMTELLDEAVILARADAEKARVAAQEEAKSILETVGAA